MAIQKNQPHTENKVPLMSRLRRGWFGPSLANLVRLGTKLWDNLNHFARTNYELGCEQMEVGNLQDAIFRFRVTTWAEPNHYHAWYNLGCCYLARGQRAKAMGSLRRALQIHPKSQEAKFMLFAVDEKALPREQMPHAMPEQLVLNQFNVDPAGYERSQLDVLGYQAYRTVTDAVVRQLDPARNDYAVLDLGCGTGLCGLALRPKAATLIGVDISPAMAEYAAAARDPMGHKLYDDVKAMDLRAFLAQITLPSYDVIVAAHVFSFVGDLAKIFEGIARGLKSGGIFAFTVEISEMPAGYNILTDLARFAFSEHYLQAEAERAGLIRIASGRVNGYLDYPMLQCLYTKP